MGNWGLFLGVGDIFRCFWRLGAFLDVGDIFGCWDVYWMLGMHFGCWDVFLVLGMYFRCWGCILDLVLDVGDGFGYFSNFAEIFSSDLPLEFILQPGHPKDSKGYNKILRTTEIDRK